MSNPGSGEGLSERAPIFHGILIALTRRIRDVAFIFDLERRPKVAELVEAAQSIDVRTLRGEDTSGQPIRFSEVQMRAIELLAEFYLRVQEEKTRLILDTNPPHPLLPVDTLLKSTSFQLRWEMARKIRDAGISDIYTPDISEVISFINEEYRLRQNQEDVRTNWECQMNYFL